MRQDHCVLLQHKHLEYNLLPTISKEQIDKVKSGEMSFSDLLKMYDTKPIDEKQLDRNRLIGSIGDSAKLLAQVFGASRGAHIQLNQPGTSLTDYFLNEENKIRELHRNQEEKNREIKAMMDGLAIRKEGELARIMEV